MKLTANQKSLLQLLSNGCSKVEVAEMTGRSLSAVYQLTEKVKRNLNASTTIEAVARAIREGHID